MTLLQDAIRKWRSLHPAKAPRVLIVGAGNCNDLSLPDICSLVSALHLVDLDEHAVHEGVQRQQPDSGTAEDAAPHRKVHVHAPIDFAFPLVAMLNGWAPALADTTNPASQSNLSGLQSALQTTIPIALPQVDIAVSLCVISQIIDGLADAIGRQPTELQDTINTLVIAHLERLLAQITPGGRCLLITDFLSSDAEPRLLRVPEDQLTDLIRDCLQAGNFFCGLNPGRLVQTINQLPAVALIANGNRDLTVHRPWRWQIGDRQFAVFCVEFRRAND